MGERKSYEYLNKLKKKLGVETLWSWSRYNSYLNDAYGYMLKYIKHIPETKKDSIWGVSGNVAHDILEQFYLGELKYEEMITEYEEKLFEMNSMELKYNRTDKDMNEKTAQKYEESIKHFFTNYKPIENKVKLEQFVTIKIGNFYFQGYLDCTFKTEDGIYIVEDFKTSTIYTGEKKLKEAGQLILYSQYLIQNGIPLDKIKLRWNFLKYCTVTSDLVGKDKEGNYKTKSKNCIRKTWVEDSSGNIKKWIKKEGFDELDIADMIQTCIENNNLETLPNSIQNRFTITDCYVNIDLNEEVINELNNKIIETLTEIESNTKTANILLEQIKQFDEVKDKKKIDVINDKLDEIFWTDIDRSKEYYFYNLLSYSRQVHKPWDEYLKEVNMFVQDTYDKAEIDTGLDWLNDL